MYKKTFLGCLSVGATGETMAFDILNASPKTAKVIDVTKDDFFQEIDVDYIQETTDGKINMYEVKTDTLAHDTGNVAIEWISNKYINSPGCCQKSKCNYFIYIISSTKQILLISNRRLQKYIYLKRPPLIPMGDNALGFLFTINELVENKIIHIVK